MKRFKISVGFAEAINCWLSPSPKNPKELVKRAMLEKQKKTHKNVILCGAGFLLGGKSSFDVSVTSWHLNLYLLNRSAQYLPLGVY